jgi:hypothetical protein
MSIRKLNIFFASCMLAASAFAGNGFVYLSDTSKLFWASNNEIYSPDKQQLLYFQKGNIFFTGDNDSRQNIFLLLTSMDVSSDKLELIYERDSHQATYSFSDYKFYAGKNETEDFKSKNELIHIQRAKKWLAFYSSIDDSLLAYYNADSLPSSTAILVAYSLIKKYALENELSVRPERLHFLPSPFVTMKPVTGNQTANEWIWDGKVLRPRWNVDQKLAWTFDGQTIKPLNSENLYEQYSWDGENFKPVWHTNRDEEWTWDGRLLKPVWNTDWANQYEIDGDIIRPWSNVHPEKEWQVDGDIPLPLIILIVSGIARPY